MSRWKHASYVFVELVFTYMSLKWHFHWKQNVSYHNHVATTLGKVSRVDTQVFDTLHFKNYTEGSPDICYSSNLYCSQDPNRRYYPGGETGSGERLGHQHWRGLPPLQRQQGRRLLSICRHHTAYTVPVQVWTRSCPHRHDSRLGRSPGKHLLKHLTFLFQGSFKLNRYGWDYSIFNLESIFLLYSFGSEFEF